MFSSCPKLNSTLALTKQKQGNTGKAAIDRISDVYRNGGGRAGRGKAAKPGSSTKNKAGAGGELPNVYTVARFAIERERLAREMGVDELGGPATLGVVNVGAALSPNRQQQQQQSRRNLTDRGGGRGNKRARNHERGGGRGKAVDGGSRGGGRRAGENEADLPAPEPEVVAERRSSGELLLEKLESVAEARSIESAGGLRGGGDRAEEQRRVPYGNWHTEEESSFFNDPAGEREAGAGAGVAGAGAPWGTAPVAGELSTTESAFLERSRRLNGLDGGSSGGDPLFGQHFEAGFRDEKSLDGDGSGGGSAAHVATIGALRDRLATLEGENGALRARARRAEEERAAEAARGDRASKKLAQVTTVFAHIRAFVVSCLRLSQRWGVNAACRVAFRCVVFSPNIKVSWRCVCGVHNNHNGKSALLPGTINTSLWVRETVAAHADVQNPCSIGLRCSTFPPRVTV